VAKKGSLYVHVGKRKPSPRAERRARDRDRAAIVRDLERLARAAPGGSPERPHEVASPAQVEPIASASRCPLCEERLRLDEHRAETIDGARLRVASMRCPQCGVARSLYFRLAATRLN
jgi:hypothetical protein